MLMECVEVKCLLLVRLVVPSRCPRATLRGAPAKAAPYITVGISQVVWLPVPSPDMLCCAVPRWEEADHFSEVFVCGWVLTKMGLCVFIEFYFIFFLKYSIINCFQTTMKHQSWNWHSIPWSLPLEMTHPGSTESPTGFKGSVHLTADIWLCHQMLNGGSVVSLLESVQ